MSVWLGALWLAVSSPVSAGWNPKDKAVDVYNAGIEALNAGDLDAAWEAFRKAEKKDPGCGRCGVMLAEIELRRNDPEAALTRLRGLRSTHPHQPDLLALQAEALFVADQYDAAHAAALDAAEQDPASLRAWQWAFRSGLRRGDDRGTQLALGHLRKLLPEGQAKCFEVELLLERDQTEAAAERLPDCAAASPDHGASLEAQLQSDLGDQDALMAALEASDSGARAAEVRIARLLHAGDPVGAARVGRDALAAHPDDWLLLLRTAEALSASGDDAGALSLMERVFGAKLDVEATREGGLVGVLTHSGALQAQEVVARALVTYVAHRAEQGAVERARAAIDRAEAGWPGGRLGAGGAVVLAASTSGAAAAWPRLEAGLAEAPEARGLLAAAAWMAQAHPGKLPPAVLAALRGPDGAWTSWTVAHAVQDGHPALCVSLLRDRPPLPKLAAAWWELLASCASAAGDEALAGTAREALEAEGGDASVVRYNAAVSQSRRGEWRAAVATLEGLSPADPELAGAARSLQVSALTHLGELDAARAAVTPEVDLPARYNLALALSQAERPAEAAALLVDVRATDRDLDRQMASLLVELHAQRADLDAALAVLEERATHPVSRANLAVALYNAQRLDEAHAITRSACGELEGEPRTFCDDLHAAIEAAR